MCSNKMSLYFGARGPGALPYFGPLAKMPQEFLEKHFAFSRLEGEPKVYVQDKMREARNDIVAVLNDPDSYIYVCGLKAMEAGVEEAFEDIARGAGLVWKEIRNTLREEGRYHVETY